MSTTRTNLLPSPNDTAVVGAAAERFSNLGSGVGITVSAAQRGSRAVVRVTASAATTQLGVRTKLTLNSPNVSESTVFWFSADVFIPANVPGPNITVTFRDDPNNDSGTGIFDPSTPSARLLTDIARDTWVRLSWKATVKAGRTVTAVQMWTGATSHAAGIWWETSRWHVEASTSSVAPVWFDGDTGDDLIPPEIVIRDWTGVPKESTSTEVTSVPQISLAWVSTSGSVRFTVTDAIAGQTVKRLTPSNTLQGIRGYGDDSWISGGSGFGYDYEMELGVTVRYALVDKAATTLPAGASVASVFTQTPGRANGEAWLRDVMQPILSQPVSVISTGDERRVARQAVYDIAGKAEPGRRVGLPHLEAGHGHARGAEHPADRGVERLTPTATRWTCC